MEIQSANRQHPVPQNVMDVEFKLIGELTIRQFSYLLVFGFLFLVFYKFPLPIIFKLPLLLIIVFAGLGFAFFPYNDITLDKWTVNYIRAITNPRIRIWKHLPTIPYFFSLTPKNINKKDETQAYKKEESKKTYKELLKQGYFKEELNSFNDDSDITQREIAYLQKVGFKVPNPKSGIKNETIVPEKTDTTRQNIEPRDKQKTILKEEEETKREMVKKTLNTLSPKRDLDTQIQKAFSIGIQEDNEKTKREVKANPNNQKDMPNTNKEEFEPKEKKSEEKHASVFSFIERLTHKANETEKELQKKEGNSQNKKGVKKNIKGKVSTNLGELLPNTIVIIKDDELNPRIALKTNQLGEFETTTPLEQGKYQIDAIKEGYKFDKKQIIIDENELEPINLIGTKV